MLTEIMTFSCYGPLQMLDRTFDSQFAQARAFHFDWVAMLVDLQKSLHKTSYATPE